MEQRGYTLVELLVTIAIVLVLASLVMAGTSGVRRSGNRAAAFSQMRQIGVALSEYTAEHNGFLPGPLRAGQGACYDPGLNGGDQLGTALGLYLGVEDFAQKAAIKIFLPPAYRQALPLQAVEDAVPYVLNISASANGVALKPWGSQASQDKSSPMTVAAVPVRTWALCDADQLNPLVAGQPWATSTPAKPIHGAQRLALYFDGSASSIEDSALQKSPAPPPPPPPPPPSGGGPGGGPNTGGSPSAPRPTPPPPPPPHH